MPPEPARSPLMREAALNPKRKSFASAVRRALHASLALLRFLNYHQWLTSAFIVGGAIATLILWTLLLPLPEAHGAYTIPKSLRFNDNDSAYLSNTPGSDGTRTTWTFSTWVKRGNLSGGTIQQLLAGALSSPNVQTKIEFDASDHLEFQTFNSPSYLGRKVTTQVFRDPAAWYHLIVVWDTNNATASDRMRVYVNGQRVTAFDTSIDPASGTLSFNNAGSVLQTIGTNSPDASVRFLDAYLSDVYFIDGQALGPESFAETDSTTGSWKAKSYSGTYGTNGFHLDFTDSSTLGNDVSGNGNDWTSNNLDATDQMRDTPTNNFATWNPLDKYSGEILANGNLSAQTANANGFTRGNFGMSSGKWYWEVTLSSGGNYDVGIANAAANISSSAFVGADANSWGYYVDGTKMNGGSCNGAYGTGSATGDVISVALDMDSGKIWWARNGTWQASGDPAAGTNYACNNVTGPVFPAFSDGGSAVTANGITNFGQGGTTSLTYYAAAGGSFKYAPPQGYKALSTSNLPAPAIAKPSNFFDAKTYTGNASTQSITGLNFQPALTWLKDRTSANSHGLFDAVRGATQWLASNSTAAEASDGDSLTAFNANGFSLGADAKFNTSGNSYISWNWKESATSGFDIVTGTKGSGNEAFNHSLGTAPAMYIVKSRGSTGWWVNHKGLSNQSDQYLGLADTNAAGTLSWGGVPTASQFYLSTGFVLQGDTFVAYVFAEVPGFSKFGSYTGNGSADGPFVYTGFKPRFVMIKKSSATGDWMVVDTARNPSNVVLGNLYPNLTNAEETAADNESIDILSNGFKIRNTSSNINTSGATYIYAAFAESPFKYSTAGSGLVSNAANFIAWEF